MRRGFLRTGAILLGCAAPLAAASLGGCAGRTQLFESLVGDAGVDAGEPDVDAGPPPITKASKVDLLLVVDNSLNTGAFQGLLADTVPYLLDRLAHPACVNGLGNVVATTPGPDDPCPVGERDFEPITDLHLAMITTSLGGHGADLCSPASTAFDPEQDDAAHLVSRDGVGGVVPTYGGEGFLAWDPAQKMSPPGDGDLGALSVKLSGIVRGAGSKGCGFESQLESIYRFLVEPNPYQSIQVGSDGKAQLVGTDGALLKQRADFLRPDSALVVVLVTDENDCSTREGGQLYLSNQGADPNGNLGVFHLPRARSECAQNPNDPCCSSCGLGTPAGCPPTPTDPSCTLPPFSSKEDPINLRCFDQKRRFGIDFLYPLDRYVRGLSDAQVSDRDGNVVDNPLFAGNRSPELVMVTGIVGVPWQDVAADPKSLGVGYRTAAEIDWDMILGDPASGALPTDPLMRESIAPRSGSNPATGAVLAPPESPAALANPINGHERVVADGDDLQYACIYPLPAPIACGSSGCECVGNDIQGNPLCQGPDGSFSSTQLFAKALPGRRELAVLRGLGARATVASVCAAEVSGKELPTFGYKPAVDATLRSLRLRLK